MKDRLVSDCILVLQELSRGDKHVHLIIEQTGLYKNFVYAAIKALKRGELVNEIKSPHHKQMKVQKLSELGIEIAQTISDIEQNNRSHAKLKKVLVDVFGIAENLDEGGIKRKLMSIGWSTKEIPFYREFIRYALLLITESLNMIYNALTYRYSELSLKYDVRNIAKLILNKVILDALEYHVTNARDTGTMRQLYYMKNNNEGTRIIMDRLLSSINTIEDHNPYLNRFTDKEGASLLSSICCMLKVPNDIVQDYISDVNQTLKVFGEEALKAYGLESSESGPESYFVKGVMYKDAYKETRRIARRKLWILNEMVRNSS